MRVDLRISRRDPDIHIIIALASFLKSQGLAFDMGRHVSFDSDEEVYTFRIIGRNTPNASQHGRSAPA